MEIFLIRHTSVKIEKGICYGQSDVDVANTFELEMESIKKKIAHHSEMIIYSSPLKRCLHLARELVRKPPIVDNRLLELNFGDWELKKWNLIEREEFQKWENNIKIHKCPNGESFLELYTRTTDFFKEIIKLKHEKVVIITHSGVIRSIISYILKIPLQNAFSIQLDYSGVSKIIINQDEKFGQIVNIEFINR